MRNLFSGVPHVAPEEAEFFEDQLSKDAVIISKMLKVRGRNGKG